MNEICFGWQDRGSAIISADAALRQILATGGSGFSLRQALLWQEHAPNPPHAGQSLVVFGLDLLLQILEPASAEQFLQNRIKPLIRWVQQRWSECGLLFAMPAAVCREKRTEVLFTRNDQEILHLSKAMWGALEEEDIARIVNQDNHSEGYHVTRI